MTKMILRGAGLLAACVLMFTAVQAQNNPTPITVQLATSTPLPVLGGGTSPLAATPIPTETPRGGAFLEALDSVNVRAEASTEGERLGLIAPGETFLITGRYFRWLQFKYPNSPSGTGWVYDELVTITGDELLIPDLSVAPPTADPLTGGATQTADAMLAVPGGEMTATASARILEGPVAVQGSPQAESILNPAGDERLPTFTPAPNAGELVASANIQPTSTPETVLIQFTRDSGSFPPVLPIVALVGFGMLGLAVSFIRR